MSEPCIIQLRAVTKNYPMGEVTVHALRGLDLELRGGEFVVLLGPSGSGKTTILNLIGGLDQPTGGQVLVEGRDIARFNESQLTAYRRSMVGFIFQFFNLIPTLSALENVEFALALNQHDGDLQAKARDLLGLVGLGERGGHFQRSSRAASSSGWLSPGRSPTGPRSCCATSRPATWTPKPGKPCCG